MKKCLLLLLSFVALAANAQAPEGVEIVDLGLSVKWASMNVGAAKAEDYGDYFAWGETEGYNSGKTSFSWSTYKLMTEGQSTWQYVNKYQYADGQTSACWYDSNGNFIGDGKRVLEAADDAATANWGSDWRMPTYDELSELTNTDNCSWAWYASGNTEFNGVAGYKLQSMMPLPKTGAATGAHLQKKTSRHSAMHVLEVHHTPTYQNSQHQTRLAASIGSHQHRHTFQNIAA